MPVLSPSPKQQFTDNSGNLAAGHKLYTYAAGTTNPLTTYKDRGGVSANTNPIILNSRGEATVYLQEDKSYDFKFESPDGSTTWTQAGVEVGDMLLRDDLASAAAGKGSEILSFLQTGIGAVVRNVLNKLRERVSVKDFGAVGDGVSDDSAAFAAAIAAGRRIHIPAGTYRVGSEIYINVSNRMLYGDGVAATTIICDLTTTNAIRVSNEAHHVRLADFTVSRAAGAVPATSVGIKWGVFNYGSESNVRVSRHGYGRHIHHESGSTSIGYRAVDCTADDCSQAYLRVGEAADVYFIGSEFGRNATETIAPLACVEINGAANAVHFTDTTMIPRGSNSGTTTTTFYFKGFTGSTGVFTLSNVNTENVKHVFGSDAATVLIPELKIVGGRLTNSGANTFNMDSATIFENLRITGSNFGGGPTTIFRPKWASIVGTFFDQLTVNSTSAAIGTACISGCTVAGTLTLAGVWGSLQVFGTDFNWLVDTASPNGGVSISTKERLSFGNALYWGGSNLGVGRNSATARNERVSIKSFPGQAAMQSYCDDATGGNYHTIFTSNVGSTESDQLVIRVDGNIYNSNNVFGALSDARLKADVTDAGSQWDDVKALRLRKYTLKGTGERHIGLVAQEVQTSSPGLVFETPNGMMGVNYSVGYMKALGALQEAMARIEALEAMLTD